MISQQMIFQMDNDLRFDLSLSMYGGVKNDLGFSFERNIYQVFWQVYPQVKFR